MVQSPRCFSWRKLGLGIGIATLLSLVVGSNVTVLGDEDEARESRPKSELGRALGLRIAEIEPLGAIDAETRETVGKITLLDTEVLGEAEVYRAQVVKTRRSRTQATICRLPLGRPEIGDAVVVAIDEEWNLLGTAVVDEEDDALRQWTKFTGQFSQRMAPQITTARPHSSLAERVKMAESGGDETSRLMRALLAQRTAMHSQAGPSGSLFTAASRKIPIVPELLDVVREDFRTLADLSGDLKPLLGEASEEFVRISEAMIMNYEEMGRANEKEDFDRAATLVGSLRANCVACHNLEGHRGEDIWRIAAARRIDELGVGDNYFLLDHDVRPGRNRRRDQIVATAIRAACLLADGTKTD